MTNLSVARSQVAVGFASYGSADVLGPVTVPVRDPGPGEVRVRVAAAAVNPADWRLRSGQFRRLFRLRLPFVPGSDAAGVVDAAGDGAGPGVGDRVVAVSPTRAGGAYAPFLTLPARQVVALPDGVSLVDAAALPLAGLTAYQALAHRAGVGAGMRVLVHGAAGGVGTFAVQVARALGARVTAAASARHADLLAGLGADEVVDRHAGPSALGVGYDAVLDASGALGLPAARRLLRPGGTAVTVHPGAGLLHPDWWAPARGGRRLRSVAVRPDGDDLAALVAMAAGGRLRPVVASVRPVAEAAAAHRESETLRVAGKLVLVVDDSLVAGDPVRR